MGLVAGHEHKVEIEGTTWTMMSEYRPASDRIFVSLTGEPEKGHIVWVEQILTMEEVERVWTTKEMVAEYVLKSGEKRDIWKER